MPSRGTQDSDWGLWWGWYFLIRKGREGGWQREGMKTGGRQKLWCLGKNGEDQARKNSAERRRELRNGKAGKTRALWLVFWKIVVWHSFSVWYEQQSLVWSLKPRIVKYLRFWMIHMTWLRKREPNGTYSTPTPGRGGIFLLDVMLKTRKDTFLLSVLC